MAPRANGVTVELIGLGVGEVVRDVPLEDLIPPQLNVIAPKAYATKNLAMYEGAARLRSGYSSLAATPDSTGDTVVHLQLVQFDTGTVELLRFTKAKVLYYNTAVNPAVWATLSPTPVTLTAKATDIVTATMAQTLGGGKHLMFCNGVDAVYKYTGSGATATTVNAGVFIGAKVLLGHRSRVLVMNMVDGGTRRTQRVWRSIIGDSTTFTGTGSGYDDLTDDAYPIVSACVISGRVCVFKGDAMGGAIVVGTPTGSATTPYRWDTVNTDGVGILFPRTRVALTADLTFFVGHDGFYVYDGARAMQRVSETIARSIIARVNINALHAGHAFYDQPRGEIYVHLPVDGSVVANETWVFNVRDRRVYGPYTYGQNITTVSYYGTTGILTWDAAAGTWDTNGYTTWNAAATTAIPRRIVYGDSTGGTWAYTGSETSDSGLEISGEYISGAIRAANLVIPGANGGQRQLRVDDVLTLHDVTLKALDVGVWTPRVSVSTDGGTSWSVISDGTTMGTAGASGKVLVKHYTLTDALASTWFQFKIAGETAVALHGMRLEFSYVGSDRNS